MNASQTTPGRVVYFNNMMVLLMDCLGSDAAYRMRCITARMAGVACGCVLPLVILLGVLGNGLVGYAMLAKIRPLSRQNVYFGCIALVDAVTMTLFGLVNFFLSRGLPWLSGGSVGYIMQNYGYIGRKMYMAVTTLCPLLSATMLLVMVADRLLSLVMPFRFRTLGPKFAFKSMTIGFLASVALSIYPIVKGNRYINERGSVPMIFCFFELHENLALLYWSLVCNPPTLLLAVILLLNFVLLALIVQLVRQRKRCLSSHSAASGEDSRGSQHLSGAVIVLVSSTATLVSQLPTAALY